MFLPNNPIWKYLFIAISLIAPALHVIFPFGEDKGLQKRGVKKTKILFRTIGIAILIYILTYYFLEQL